MGASLIQRLQTLIHAVLDSYSGAWLAWCDPHDHWKVLLEQAAARDGTFTLVSITERTGAYLGGPLARREVEKQLKHGERLVLRLAARPDDLGWLWAHVLRAERIYQRSLREQLLDWGWRPPTSTIDNAALVEIARRQLDRDPAEWSSGALQPDVRSLLPILAGLHDPEDNERLLLDITTAAIGLPPVDRESLGAWRRQALAMLLVAQAAQVAPEVVTPEHALLPPVAQRQAALELLEQWSDAYSLRARLAEAIQAADDLTGLRDVQEASGVFLSRAAEQGVLTRVCSDLARQHGLALLQELASHRPMLTQHAEGFWGKDAPQGRGLPWVELERLSAAAVQVLAALPTATWATVDEALAWYVAQGWQLDAAGEEIMRAIPHPAPELLPILEPLRTAYQACWEELSIHWSQTWETAGCPELPYPSAGAWLKEMLDSESNRPVAILVIDALRFDLGNKLAARINDVEGTVRASVQPAQAPLPSITALGMGFALPLPVASLTAEVVEGKWQLWEEERRHDLSEAPARRAWWLEHGVPDDRQLSIDASIASKLPAPAPGARLIIHDALIDKLGHDDELERLGADAALNRYIDAIERLRDCGWRRIFIVTDHGFIHAVPTHERSSPLPAPQPAFSSRRALAYPHAITWTGPQVFAPGGHWRVAVPSGVASFRTYGGSGYFHGGASLQEWVIP
jgi:hypothetical protein